MNEPTHDLLPEEDLRAALQAALPAEADQLRRIRARVSALETQRERDRRAFRARPRWFQAAALLLLPKVAVAKGLTSGAAVGGKTTAQAAGLGLLSLPAILLIVVTGLFGALLQRLLRTPTGGQASGRSTHELEQRLQLQLRAGFLLGWPLLIALHLFAHDLVLPFLIGGTMIASVNLLGILSREGITSRAEVSGALARLLLQSTLYLAMLHQRISEDPVPNASYVGLLVAGCLALLVIGDPGRIGRGLSWMRHAEDSGLHSGMIACLRVLRTGFVLGVAGLLLYLAPLAARGLMVRSSLQPQDLRTEVLALDIAEVQDFQVGEVLLYLEALRSPGQAPLAPEVVEHLQGLPRASDLQAYGLLPAPDLDALARDIESLTSPRLEDRPLTRVEEALVAARSGLLTEEGARILHRRSRLTLETYGGAWEADTLMLTMRDLLGHLWLERELRPEDGPLDVELDGELASLLQHELELRWLGDLRSEDFPWRQGPGAFRNFPPKPGEERRHLRSSFGLSLGQTRATIAALLILQEVGVPESIDLDRLRTTALQELAGDPLGALVGSALGQGDDSLDRLRASAFEHLVAGLPAGPRPSIGGWFVERYRLVSVLLALALALVAVLRAPRGEEQA